MAKKFQVSTTNPPFSPDQGTPIDLPAGVAVNQASPTTTGPVSIGIMGPPGPPGLPGPTGPAGPKGDSTKSAASLANKRMHALATSADGDKAVAETLVEKPMSYIVVRLNGIGIAEIGDGTTNNAVCYFSGDQGVSARAWADVAQGDSFHWQGSVAGFELVPTDVFDFDYEKAT